MIVMSKCADRMRPSGYSRAAELLRLCDEVSWKYKPKLIEIMRQIQQVILTDSKNSLGSRKLTCAQKMNRLLDHGLIAHEIRMRGAQDDVVGHPGQLGSDHGNLAVVGAGDE